MNIEIKIDYFSATFPLDVDADDDTLFKVYEMVKMIANFLNVNNYEIVKAKYAQNNYNHQFTLGENITLRLDGPMNDCYQKTCHLELKGEGCREFERRNPDKSWVNFILFMAELNARFKRIDLAIDDFKGDVVTLGFLQEKILKRQYTSVFRSYPTPHGYLDSGLTLQFGTTESPIQLVIYDKFKERSKRKKETDKTYWVRYEMRFRNQTADRFALTLIQELKADKSLQTFAFEQLYRILDIKEDNNYDEKSQNKVETDKRWLAFLENVSKGELVKGEDGLNSTFNSYLKAAMPYLSVWLMYNFLSVMKDPYLFELEIYKFMRDALAFSKKRLQRLNIFLAESHLKTIDDADFIELKEEFKEIVSERELPF